MTRPTTTGKAQDLITFTRSTTGTALAKISYGEELVTNGDFSNGTTGWNFRTETPESGRARLNNTSLGNITYYNQTAVGEVGKAYVLTYDVLATNGATLALQQATNLSLDTTTTGSKRLTFNWSRVGGALTIKRLTSNTDVIIDNISVKEVLYDQPDGTLQLLNHPINKPRIEYDAEGNCLGLLVEEGRTNVLTNSNVPPSGGGAVLVKNASAPNGAQDAWTMTYSSGVGYTAPSGASFISGTSYTFSFYFKRGTGTQQIWTLLYGSVFNNNGSNVVAIYDIESETATISLSGATANVQAVGNGWYRCSCSAIATASSTAGQQIYRQGATDTGKYDYVYGFQVEQGSFPTSYIPTSGSTVTRAADVASLAVSEFEYNQGQGTVFINCLITEQPDFNLRVIDGNSNTKRWMYVNAPDNDYGLKYFDGTNNPTLVSSGIPLNMKAAVAVTPTQVFGAANSSAVGSGAHNGTLLDISQFNFFANLNGHIKSVQYYPLRLSNAQLQALTV